MREELLTSKQKHGSCKGHILLLKVSDRFMGCWDCSTRISLWSAYGCVSPGSVHLGN